MEIAIAFIVGVIAGAVIALIISAIRARAGRGAFTAMATEARDANSRRLAELAGATSLESKKELIDQSLLARNERLERLRGFVQRVESKQQERYGEFTTSLTCGCVTPSLLAAGCGSRAKMASGRSVEGEGIIRRILGALAKHLGLREQKLIDMI